MLDGGHRDAFHPDAPDPACPDCQAAARKIAERSAQGEGTPAPSTPRLVIEDHLSLVLFRPADDASYAALCAVIDEQCDEDQRPLFFGRALAVEPRYADQVAGQLAADGFEVQRP